MSAAMSARLMTGHFSALMRADQEGGGEGLLTQCCNMAWNPASADGWSRSMTWTRQKYEHALHDCSFDTLYQLRFLTFLVL